MDAPDLVRDVHREYVLSGAQVIESNTFGANRYRLRSHGREADLESINLAGARLAREAAGPGRWVAGSMGPTGLLLKTLEREELEEVEGAFAQQAEVLRRAEVDFLLLETFRQPKELDLAIRACRRVAADLPIVASVSFDAFGEMSDGTGPELMAKRIADLGADALGVNCADGPAGVYEMATRVLDVGLPVIAQPNAGLPRRVEGRFAYMATPEYFRIYSRLLFKAGVRGVGGCCGTTAKHIKKIASSARMVGGTPVDPGGGRRDAAPPEIVEVIAVE
ncbi:MAG: homocysteine S-methyltransferase family protein [Myxococcota bacterium]